MKFLLTIAYSQTLNVGSRKLLKKLLRINKLLQNLQYNSKIINVVNKNTIIQRINRELKLVKFI